MKGRQTFSLSLSSSIRRDRQFITRMHRVVCVSRNNVSGLCVRFRPGEHVKRVSLIIIKKGHDNVTI